MQLEVKKLKCALSAI